MCSASTATSSIILLRDDKYIVKGNNHNKQEGAFPKREKSKFSSATSLILVILVCRTCLYNGPHLIFKPCIQSNCHEHIYNLDMDVFKSHDTNT